MSFHVSFCLVFLVLLVLRLPRLGKRELIFSYVCSICACLDLSASSSSWGLGRAAVCDYGTPWTFLLPFSAVCLKKAEVSSYSLSTKGLQ